MARLKHSLVVLLTFIVFTGSSLAAENTPNETSKQFYKRHLQEAETLKQEAEREVRYSDVAQKYRELVDKAVGWEEEGLKRYGDSPDLPRLAGDAYFKSTALAKYAEYLGLDFRSRIEATSDPYKKFSLLQEWTDKSFDYVGEIWNDTWDERAVSHNDVMNEVSQAFGTELYGIGDLFGESPGVLNKLFKIFGDLTIDGENFDITIERRPGVAHQIFDTLDEQMRQETNPTRRFELLRDRIIKTDWVLKTAHNHIAFDEQYIPGLGGNGLGESEILKEQSTSLVRDLKELIDKESDPPTKRQLAEKLIEVVKWLKEKWKSAGFNDYQPDMSDWPSSIEDILGENTVPIGPRLPSGRTTTPQEPAKVTSTCDFDGFIACRDTFNLQGCIDACPFVSVDCPSGSAPSTECKQTDQKCSDTCWDRGTTHGSQCAIQNNCTMQEIENRLRAQ
ncbi:MAG: hypothetical protein HYW45_03240 [Candidatus Daviesbacteria bacterium]|nr:MAG: hypothetical protein HYW45_03240 [Candidatus Daviesbacteria bacterium]